VGASALGSADEAAWAGWNPRGKSKQYIISPVKGRLSDQSPILRSRVSAVGFLVQVFRYRFRFRTRTRTST
jgi:hypothetical protein